MNDMQKRQLNIAIDFITKYQEKLISLDSLIQNLEVLLDHLGLEKYEIFSETLVNLEITNSFLVEEKREPTLEETSEIRSNVEVLKSILRNS